MSLHAPKLDDRSFDDLVDEAKRRIAARCPRWTDFNPSDPGMMLVELMAWLTDTVLYRLNRVPELNYVKFLELIGVRLQPPRPARTWVFFEVKANQEEEALELVPEKTRISTRPKADQPPVTFATCRALNLTSRKIVMTGSKFRAATLLGQEVVEREVEHDFETSDPQEAPMFGPEDGQGVPHRLYLGDAGLSAFLGKWTALHVQVNLEKPASHPLLLQWETWDGEGWQNVAFDTDSTAGLTVNGNVTFGSLPLMKKATFKTVTANQIVNLGGSLKPEEEALWLRARLVGTSAEVLPVLGGVEWHVDLEEHDVLPQKAMTSVPPPEKVSKKVPQLPILPLMPLEIGTDFFPFGLEPATGSAFYLQSELFQSAGARITIQFDVKQELKPKEQQLEIHWEYFSRSERWKRLGVSRPGGVSDSTYNLRDETRAFTQNGMAKIEFQCPADVQSTRLGGDSGWFIRARIEKANLGDQPDDRLIAQAISLGLSQTLARPWTCCLSENYSSLKFHSRTRPFSPFYVAKDKDPAFYICFDKPLSSLRTHHRLFIDIVPQTVKKPQATSQFGLDQADEGVFSWRYDAKKGWVWGPSASVIEPLRPKLQWEYATGEQEWEHLEIGADETEGLAHTGMVEFVCPAPNKWKITREFKQFGYWLRVRWELAEFVEPPRLRRLKLNGVEVEQLTFAEATLGSSKGIPGQSFPLRREILDSPEIWIQEDEPVVLSDSQGREVKCQPASNGNGFWVKWLEVPTFHRSEAIDRHFTADLEKGEFFFGDGTNGAIPPKGENNVKVVYRVTQGAAGNVGPGTINVLETSLPNVQAVTNLHPAEGGCDREDMAHARERGPWEIKHGNRAVSEEDFIRLAKKASVQVGKTACFVENGIINVVVVPSDGGDKPQPSQRLLQQVFSYLDDKRLINTRVRVRGPFYEFVDVEIGVVLETPYLNRFGEVKQEVEERLRSFVHPLTGLADGLGWPMGRTLHLSELYYRLESLPGVDHIERLKLRRTDAPDWEDSIKIGPRSFPCFSQNMKIEQSYG